MKFEDTALFDEVNKLAEEKKYRIEISVLSSEHPLFDKANGATAVNVNSKTIEISLREEYTDHLGIWAHEFLHAKLFLLGYPKIYMFPDWESSNSINTLLHEVENIAQHTVIYKEMKLLGYDHDDLNIKFIEEVGEHTNVEFKGPNVILRAFRILEAHYRNYELLQTY